jgi:hypothetical protein
MTAHDDEAMAAADKEMEERANRVKHLLSQRYQGLKNDQVRFFMSKLAICPSFISLSISCLLVPRKIKGGKTCA